MNHACGEQCPWPDVLQELAWWVWHDATLFEEMKTEIPCHIGAAAPNTIRSQREAWFKWLAASRAGTSCNLHDLWLWYFKTRLEPALTLETLKKNAPT